MDTITFYYDASRQGYDTTLWKTLTGTPGTSGDYLRLNQDEIIHYGDINKGRVVFDMIIPDAPAAGDVKRWGFANNSMGYFAGFRILEDVFTAAITDGTTTTSTTLTWDADWEAAVVKYEVIWRPAEVEFKINDVTVAKLDIPKQDLTDHSPAKDMVLPPMSVYLENQENDNMDVASITVQTKSYI